MALTTAAALAGLGGAALGAFGASKQASAQRSAAKAAANAAKFNPFQIRLPGSHVGVTERGATGILDDERRHIRDFFGKDSLAQLNIMGKQDPYARAILEQQLGQQGRQQGSAGMFDQFNQFMNQPDILGPQTQQFLQQTGGFANQLQGLGQAGLGAMFGAPSAQGLMGQQMGIGQQLLGSQGQDFQSAAADRLGLLRQQAQPFEQDAANAFQQRLFNTGQLATTGGSKLAEAFGRGMGQADTQRQIAAQDFGDQLSSRSQQLAFGRQQLGSTLFGQALGGFGQEQLQSRALGGIGMQGLGQLPGLFQGQLGAVGNLQDTNMSRAGQRIQAAEGMFGFGNQITDAPRNRILGNLDISQTFDQNLLDAIGVSGNISAQVATAGANQGRFLMQGAGSPMGGFMSGLGSSLMSGARNGMFGGGVGMAGAGRDIDALMANSPDLFGFSK